MMRAIDHADFDQLCKRSLSRSAWQRSSDAVRGEGPRACEGEIEKFCRGEERAGRCLRDKDPNEVSEGCKAHWRGRVALARYHKGGLKTAP